MTDDELIQLVRETPPDELSAEQIAHLRRRLLVSEPLRRELTQQIRLEQQLNTGLGRPGIRAEAIVARHDRHVRTVRWWRFTAAMMLVACGALVWQWWDSAERPTADDAENVTKVTVVANEASKTTAGVANSLSSGSALSAATRTSNSSEPRATEALGTASPATSSLSATANSAAAAAPEPWEASLARPSRPGDIADFDELPLDLSGANASQLLRWWQPVEGQSRTEFIRKLWFATFSGVFTLRAPWQPGTAWRMNVGEAVDFRLHCWNGPQGVALAYRGKGDQRWTAYRIERTNDAPLPERQFLLGCDDELYQRLGRGTLQLRWQDGYLVIRRADITVLAVPLAEAPSQVVLETRNSSVLFSAMDLVRCEPINLAPFPTVASAAKPTLASSRPAELDWQFDGETSPVTATSEGAVLLTSQSPESKEKKKSKDRFAFTRAWLAVADPGIQSVIVHLQSLPVDAGVYLGDSEGKPIVGLGVSRKDAKQPCRLAWQVGRDLKLHYSKSEEAVDLPEGPCWLKLQPGAGIVRAYLSADGERWLPILPPWRSGNEPWSTLR